MMCHPRRVNYSSAISFVYVQQKIFFQKIPSHLHKKFWIHSILVGGSGHVTAMSLLVSAMAKYMYVHVH